MAALLRWLACTSILGLFLVDKRCQVSADLERTCEVQDYRYLSHSRYGSQCRVMLFRILQRRCPSIHGENAEKLDEQTGKDVPSTDVPPADVRPADVPSAVSGPFITQERAKSVLVRDKRSIAGGIVCECCIHSCTAEELVQHCPTSSGKHKCSIELRHHAKFNQGKWMEEESAYFLQKDLEDVYLKMGKPYP